MGSQRVRHDWVTCTFTFFFSQPLVATVIIFFEIIKNLKKWLAQNHTGCKYQRRALLFSFHSLHSTTPLHSLPSPGPRPLHTALKHQYLCPSVDIYLGKWCFLTSLLNFREYSIVWELIGGTPLWFSLQKTKGPASSCNILCKFEYGHMTQFRPLFDSAQEFESEDMMHRGRKNRRNVYDNREASRIQQKLWEVSTCTTE